MRGTLATLSTDITRWEEGMTCRTPPLPSRGMDECAAVILDFLQSKCLFAVERALRLELERAPPPR